jgi:hypothetical protein
MANNFYRILGSAFMIVSAIIYTAERITAKISAAIIEANYASPNRIAIEPDYPGFFGNFFVWFFFFIGFVLLVYGFPKRDTSE